MQPELTSLWQGLSEHLLAHFICLDRRGMPDPREPVVVAPLVGGDDALTVTLTNDYAPLAEPGSSVLANLAQSGAFGPVAAEAARAAALNAAGGNPLRSLVQQTAADALRSADDSLIGRAGLTKLSSSNVYRNTQPLRIEGQLLLRAYMDSEAEVEQPLQKLVEWASPEALADDGPVLGAFTGSAERAGVSGAQRLLPSLAPRHIALRYGRDRYERMVIESLRFSGSSPIDKDGRKAECMVQFSLAAARALDKQDLRRWIRGS